MNGGKRYVDLLHWRTKFRPFGLIELPIYVKNPWLLNKNLLVSSFKVLYATNKKVKVFLESLRYKFFYLIILIKAIKLMTHRMVVHSQKKARLPS